ncbi:MAG TPA: nuclear transport factor 2 family protein [Acidimicrobiales bacterium]|nr:nuclear transport factor 2 family protein [Acidimicrobiales bacterium]
MGSGEMSWLSNSGTIRGVGVISTDQYSPDEVADRLAINAVIDLYVHAIDGKDYDALDTVFTEDARFDLHTAGGPVAGWSEVKRHYQESLDKFVHYCHVFTNVLIDFSEDRSSANTKSKVISPHELVGQDGKLYHFEIIGWYLDRWINTSEGWRISEREWHHDFIWGDSPNDLPGTLAHLGLPGTGSLPETNDL